MLKHHNINKDHAAKAQAIADMVDDKSIGNKAYYPWDTNRILNQPILTIRASNTALFN